MTTRRSDFQEQRNALRTDPRRIDIARKDFQDLMEWFKTRDCEFLTRKDDILEYEQKLLAYAQDPTKGDPPSAPLPADITAIFQFDRREFHLNPDGDWTPNSNIRFSNVRLSATARPPAASPDLSSDFRVGYNHLVDSIQGCLSGGDLNTAVQQSVGVIDSRKPEGYGFKVGRRVFVKREDDDDDGGIIETWPVSPQAAAELEKIKHTHIAIPIQAYNIAGQAIPPAQYAAELQDATVLLTFHLKHWVIQKRHTFAADIESIRVLAPPPPPTPKRKLLNRRTNNHHTGNGGHSRTQQRAGAENAPECACM